MMKILVLFAVLILMTSCGADIAEITSVTETTTVSSESLTETMTETTTAKTTTAAPIISTYETTTTVYNPLRNAVELNDVFYIDRDKSNLYLVIDEKITDQITLLKGNIRSFYLRSTQSVFNNGGVSLGNASITFNIPPAIVAGDQYYIAIDGKIEELKFLVDGKKLELNNCNNPVPEGILPISDISFAEYINPEYVLNAEDLGFEGKVTFTYNFETNTFDGEVWHNDKAAEDIIMKHFKFSDIYYDIVSVSESKIEARVISFDGVNSVYDYTIEPSNMVFERNENGWYISQYPLGWKTP
jgi:hypothetical protein